MTSPQQNARMFPHSSGKHPSAVVNGRTYTCQIGSYIDVPVFDAHGLSAQGWTRAGGPTCTVGPTSNRPTSAAGGQPLAADTSYIDTTLGYTVTWNPTSPGSASGVWRSTLTGAAV